ncbi:MAG TPA: YicC/YloC family endoribonuclease [Acidobacteriota bacterium]|nr:YicC/YloC family endoribonuclease [Acidobacteriota bacterium]
MIRSMTAFAKSSYEGKEFTLDVFVRTYNHRFLDINLKLPVELMTIEGEIRSLIGRHLSRGRVEITLRTTFLKEGIYHVIVNRGLVGRLISEMKTIQDDFGVQGEIDLAAVLRIPGLIEVQTDVQKISKDVLDEIKTMVETCLKSLVQMRLQEGQILERDLRERLNNLRNMVQRIEEHAHEYPAMVRKVTEEKMKEILNGQNVDTARLFQEIAYYAERSDITEELVRLRSHISQCETLFQKDEAVGRKLDFLLQEILREINTIGSKCDLLPISQTVIEMKTEVEKIREQSQNVE